LVIGTWSLVITNLSSPTKYFPSATPFPIERYVH
jgi:hypothetical protein